MAYESTNPFVVADAAPSDRAAFYRRTYAHVAGAFAVWAALLAGFFLSPAAGTIARMFFGGGFGMIILMIGIMFGTSVAQGMAFSRSKGVQYAGLGLAVFAEAIFFVPVVLLVVLKFGQPADPEAFAAAVNSVFAPALVTTGALVLGITASVFMTNTDFSFLRVAIIIGSFAALGVILCAMLFGFNLGLGFSLAMVALVAVSLLYQTWIIKDKVSPEQHVGAATVLFLAFISLLFWVIQLFSDRNRN